MSRVLSRVTVTPASETPQKSFTEPLVASRPPFFVESTTDVPFLAKVTLDWNGQKNAQTVVEHWVQVSHSFLFAWGRIPANSVVQIDHLKSGYATFGQEQLLDVELDRNTPLVPRQDNAVQWQTPLQATTTAPVLMPTRPVIDETEKPDTGTSNGAHSLTL